MKRVQAAFKAQLTRQNEKLEIELQEKVYSFYNCHDIDFWIVFVIS